MSRKTRMAEHDGAMGRGPVYTWKPAEGCTNASVPVAADALKIKMSESRLLRRRALHPSRRGLVSLPCLFINALSRPHAIHGQVHPSADGVKSVSLEWSPHCIDPGRPGHHHEAARAPARIVLPRASALHREGARG